MIPRPTLHRARRQGRPPQRGLAVIAVVLMLCFAAAMVAAYANRAIVFEQRTSANSTRAAQALAAAEAGIDWTIAQLNGGLIGESCEPDDSGASDFRDRYLQPMPDGRFQAAGAAGEPGPSLPVAGCAAADSRWQCSCPAGSLAPEAPSSGPAFRVLLASRATAGFGQPGVVGVRVFGFSTPAGDAQATLDIGLALLSALAVPPAAALTTGGSIAQAPGTRLRVSNPDAGTGVAVQAGGTIDGAVQAAGPAGSEDAAVVSGSETLQQAARSTQAFFQAHFGMPPALYRGQPAVARLSCAPCTAADLAAAHRAGPARILWVDGDLAIDDAVSLGTPSSPLVLVVTGQLRVDAGARLTGLVYVGGDVLWRASGAPALVRGALVAAGQYQGLADGHVVYDRAVMERIRLGRGSFVRIPGSWRTV